MSQPSVTIDELDGALGVLPPSAGKLHALVGVASQGPQNTPATFARVNDIVSSFGTGPLVEAAAHSVQRYGRPVVLVRTGQTVAGSEGTLDDGDFAGTSTVTLGTEDPNDDYDIEIEFETGGTIGTAGITYRYSLDGGRTQSAIQALGTATTIIVPGTGGLNFDFGAGTVVAGDILRTRTTAPNWNAAELTSALEALRLSAVSWDIVQVVGPIDAAAFDALELAIAAMAAVGKDRAWIGHARNPNLAETEAAYLAALTGIFASKASVRGMLCAGACKLTSAVSGRKHRRPASHAMAAREAFVSEEINTADVNLGTLIGVAIRDELGNPDEHDESVNPGLDDARFAVLRTWNEIQGVYVNRPRLFAPDGSDFRLMPHRRVINLAASVLRPYFVRRCNKPILVDKTTGFILEEEAREIEQGANAVLRDALRTKPKASDAYCVLNRNDNLLSTATLNGQAFVVPLAYVENVVLSLGFSNPALQVQGV